MDFMVRPARTSDLEAIAEFTADTFDWGDYVADHFEEWLVDENSIVLVATEETDTPIGLGRAVMLSVHEAWLHAARVNPLYRRQGVGSLLDRAANQWAKTRGARVARLLVEDWNQAAQNQVLKLGYRAAAHWVRVDRHVDRGEPDPFTNGGKRVPGDERLAPAPSAEAEPAWIAWSTSQLSTVGRSLYPLGWHLRRMTIDDVVQAAKRRAFWHCPSGWVIADEAEGELFVSWMVTNDLDASRLVRAIVNRADSTPGVHQIGMMIPAVGWTTDALESARFQTNPCTVFTQVP